MRHIFCGNLLVLVAACAGGVLDRNVETIALSDSEALGRACLTGKVVFDEQTLLTPFSEPSGHHEIAMLTTRAGDASRLRAFVGKRVTVCGRASLNVPCWTGERVCIGISKPIWLEEVFSISEVAE